MNPVSSQMHPAPMNPVSSQMYPVGCCRGNTSRPYLQLECAGSRLAVHNTLDTTQHTSLSLSGLIQLRVEMQVSARIKTKHLHGIHAIRCYKGAATTEYMRGIQATLAR